MGEDGGDSSSHRIGRDGVTLDTKQRNPAADSLRPDDPASWPQRPIEDLLALSHRDYYPQQVAALPRYHHQWLPDVIEAEPGAISPGAVRTLEAMGHKVAGAGGGALGSSHPWGNLQTVEWNKATNVLSAGSDPRNAVGEGKVEVAAPALPRR